MICSMRLWIHTSGSMEALEVTHSLLLWELHPHIGCSQWGCQSWPLVHEAADQVKTVPRMGKQLRLLLLDSSGEQG